MAHTNVQLVSGNLTTGQASPTFFIDRANDKIGIGGVPDIAGGERGGDATPLSIAMGPMSIFGSTNTNPWSSTVDVAPTTVTIKPSFNLSSPGNYNIFVEYISRNTAGELTSLTVGTGSAIPFGY